MTELYFLLDAKHQLHANADGQMCAPFVFAHMFCLVRLTMTEVTRSEDVPTQISHILSQKQDQGPTNGQIEAVFQENTLQGLHCK